MIKDFATLHRCPIGVGFRDDVRGLRGKLRHVRLVMKDIELAVGNGPRLGVDLGLIRDVSAVALPVDFINTNSSSIRLVRCRDSPTEHAHEQSSDKATMLIPP